METKVLLFVIAMLVKRGLAQTEDRAVPENDFRTLAFQTRTAEECEFDGESCPCLSPRDDGDDQTLELIDILTQGSEFLKNYTYVQEAIIALGVTGAGKTTAVQIMAGNLSKLHAVVNKGGDLVIEDEDSMIGAGAASKTYFPQLVQNRMNDSNILQFYDFPGFRDTRGSASDIAANFFMTEVAKLVGSVKLLFLVTYDAMTSREADGLGKLATSASLFVNDMEKFNQSIGLVVNKADDRKAEGYIINGTEEALSDYRTRLVGELEGSDDEDLLTSKKIRFVDIFLHKDQDGSYPNFWFIRTPDQCGSLNNSAKMQRTLIQLIDLCNSLEYTTVDVESFGFALDEKSKIEIEKTHTVALNRAIANATLNVTANLYAWYMDNKIRLNSSDLSFLAERVLNDSLKLQFVLTEIIVNPSNFSNLIVSYWETIGLEFPTYIKENLDLQMEFFQFFDRAAGSPQFRNVSMWSEELRAFHQKLLNLRTWFKFCDDLDLKLQQIDSHWNRPAIPSNPENVSWLEFIKQNEIIAVSHEVEAASSTIDLPEMKILQTLLTFALRPPTVNCSSSSDPVTRIYGNFLLLSEIAEATESCNSNIKEVHVYSAHSIFLDRDVELQQFQIALAAPYWINIGNSQRQISLTGYQGESIIPPMNRNGSSGTEDSNAGRGGNGLAGKPGGPGGFFYGVALEVLSNRQITIDTSGGDGGPGQIGGYGGAGYKDNANPCHQERGFDRPESCSYDSYTDSMRCIHSGTNGKNGGPGGDGGKGGKGGLPGTSTLNIHNNSSPNIELVHTAGSGGQMGEGGTGGPGSEAGNGYICVGQSYSCRSENPTGKTEGGMGNKGIDGASNEPPSDPLQPSKTIVDSLVRMHYRATFANLTNPATQKLHDYLATLH